MDMLEGLSSKMRAALSGEKISLSSPEFRLIESKLISSSGDAANALSEMIGITVDAIPAVLKGSTINDIPRLLNPSDGNAAVFSNKIVGAGCSTAILSASLKDILEIADILLHKERGYFRSLSSENLPAIKEFSSILAGYYVSALNELLDADYRVSPYSFSIDPYRVIEKDPYKIVEMLGFSPSSDNGACVLVFETEFNLVGYGVAMRGILLLAEKDAKKMAAKIISLR